MLVKFLVARYLEWQAEHNKPATVKYYTQGLAWVLKAFGERDWADLKRDEVKEALRAANRKKDGTPWKANTQRRNIVAIGQLQTFAIEQYDQEPLLRPKDLVKPAGDRRERIPTLEELAAIFKAAGEVSPALELAFRSLAQSGMRPNELVKAQISDLNQTRDLLLIKDHKTAKKTGKPRRIALGETMQEYVKRAIGERTTGPIWTDDGKPWTVQKLSHQFSRIKKKLALDKELVLYSFRHWKGTEVARIFGLGAAGQILGHTQLDTTRRYFHPNDDDARLWQEGKKPEEKKPIEPQAPEPKDSSDDQDTQGGVRDAA